MKSLLAGLVNGSARLQRFLEPHKLLFYKEFTVFFGPVMPAVTVSQTAPDLAVSRSGISLEFGSHWAR